MISQVMKSKKYWSYSTKKFNQRTRYRPLAVVTLTSNRVKFIKVRFVRFYGTQNSNDRRFAKGSITQLGGDTQPSQERNEQDMQIVPTTTQQQRGGQVVPVTTDQWRFLYDLMGLRTLNSEFALNFGYDMSLKPRDSVPDIGSPDARMICDTLKSLGHSRLHATFSGAAIPRYFGQHFYQCSRTVAFVSVIAAKTGRSREEILKLLRDPVIFLTIWIMCVPYGGVRVNWLDVPDLLSGGFLDALVTYGNDPVRLKQLLAQLLESSDSLTSFDALTRVGHFLAGFARHFLAILDNESIVMGVAGGGGHPFATPEHINLMVACLDSIGIWPGAFENVAKLLNNPTTVNALFAYQQNGDPRALLEAVMRIKTPEGILEWIMAHLPDPLRAGSLAIGYVTGTEGVKK
ncbi:MAG TPA: hypothetical protein VN706_25570 [Gemmatimonadaceae bacterium]|nr:hypothetical protein [Gemmatimonadaceae bacterium]